jgi:hypothetical protein
VIELNLVHQGLTLGEKKMAGRNEESQTPGNLAGPEMGRAKAPTLPLATENESLRERIEQLEQERAVDRQTIATLQAERDAYRRAVYAWALEQITEEQLQRYAQSEDGLPLENFIGELEQGRK